MWKQLESINTENTTENNCSRNSFYFKLLVNVAVSYEVTLQVTHWIKQDILKYCRKNGVEFSCRMHTNILFFLFCVPHTFKYFSYLMFSYKTYMQYCHILQYSLHRNKHVTCLYYFDAIFNTLHISYIIVCSKNIHYM